MGPLPKPDNSWLLENGPRELEFLFRTIVSYPSAPIVPADNDRHCRETSTGAAQLLALPRQAIGSRPGISEFRPAFRKNGEQAGTLSFVGRDGRLKEADYSAQEDVPPARPVLARRDKPANTENSAALRKVQDYALLLLDAEGQVFTWYGGAERLYGYNSGEALGQPISNFYCAEGGTRKLRKELKDVASGGHAAIESWHARKDGSRFWANVVTMALHDGAGNLQGFAVVVRDFTDRHQKDEKLRRSRSYHRPRNAPSNIAGIVSGEFDRISDANDVFLDLIGYSRADLQAGRIRWPDLTPPEFLALDEQAHEEAIRFGTCAPFEKELIRKDGVRVPVLIAMAVLKFSPFRWITFVQDLREPGRLENSDGNVVEINRRFEEIIGSSAAIKRVTDQVELVAPFDATVLILGETGTGKELIARAIHSISSRKNSPFITLNCAAIPTGLLESELFGYEKGAFTGALSQKIGRFEMADQGTLFLDEVGDIPLDLQPKLLRALQERALERLGGTRTIPINVRLLAATNRNLSQMMTEKLFRSDLYYRLNVFPIIAPPLREHPADIPVLARHFVRKYAAKMGRQINNISPETMNALMSWQWPGNVRELENFIERSVILTAGPSLRAPLAEIRPGSPLDGDCTLETVEREHIIRVLRESGGVVTKAATRLGLHRTTLNAIMRKLGISRTSCV
jgi:formate hydrogenlyase transcriptional activator